MADSCDEVEFIVAMHRVRADRHVTSATETLQNGSLGGDFRCRACIVKRRDEFGNRVIICTRFNSERALSDSRHHGFGIKKLERVIGQIGQSVLFWLRRARTIIIKAFNPSGGEDDSI